MNALLRLSKLAELLLDDRGQPASALVAGAAPHGTQGRLDRGSLIKLRPQKIEGPRALPPRLNRPA